VRFSTITWAVTNQVISLGLAKVDPRSGEILKSDILMSDGWVRAYLDDLNLKAPEVTHHHNMGYRAERRVAANASADGASASGLPPQPKTLLAEKLSDDAWEQIVAAGLREIVMHETGHALGLRHNFKGSLGVSYECTQDIKCSAIHGLTASVMDYVPMNIPSTGIEGVHVFTPVIGAYDKLAIQYGYSNATSVTSQGSPDTLQDLLQEAEGIQVCVDGDHAKKTDPLCQMYDFTDSPLRYYADQLELVKKVQQHLLNASVAPDHPYWEYGMAVSTMWGKVNNIASDLCNWIGGVNASYVHRGADGANRGRQARQPIPVTLQAFALNLTMMILQPHRSGLLPPLENHRFLINRISVSFNGVVQEDVESLTRKTRRSLVTALMNRSTLLRLETNAVDGGLSVDEFLRAIATVVFEPDGQTLESAIKDDWDLQQLAALRLGTLVNDAKLPESIAVHVAFYIDKIQNAIGMALRKVSHLQHTSEKLRVVHLQRLHGHLIQFQGAVHLHESAASAKVLLWPVVFSSCFFVAAIYGHLEARI
jgi:hypothetical protein